MSNLTVSVAVDNFMGAANQSSMRTLLALGNVNNTSDANKPISTATQTALDLKSPLVSPSFTTPNLGVASATSITTTGKAGFGIAVSSTTFVNTAASTTAASSLRMPHGTAPSAPVNGDFWTTTAGFFGRINNATIQFGTGGGGSGTVSAGTTNTLSKYTATTTVGDSLLTDDGTTLAYSGTGGISLASGSVAGALELVQGTTQSAGTTSVTFQAPAAVTSYLVTVPGTVGSNNSFWTQSTSGTTATLLNTRAVPTGAVVGDTDAQTLSSKKLQFSASLGSNNTYDGITIAGLNAGATIAQWEIVYLGASSTWLLADANGSGTYPACGMAVAAYSSTNPAIIITRGTVRNDTWNWTPGGRLYLSGTPGGLTQTAPSASSDKVQDVGFALTADIAYLDFNGVYLTVQ